MSPSFSFALVFLALLIEALAGYPHGLFKVIGHPVTWIGHLIRQLDRRLNRADLPEATRRRNGTLALTALLLASVLPVWLLQAVLLTVLPVPLALLLLSVLASSLIAQRSLYSHVRAVAEALQAGRLEVGRRAVSRIVGRDPETLDAAGIARAAIESLAENFSDAVVAPAFWGCLLGLPGMAAYKAINTADSMIGHLTPRFAAFGRASAKLDDWVNFFPARIAALLLSGAAVLDRSANASAAYDIAVNHAHRHRSPNAGWPEGAMAGALGIMLAGPRSYGGRITDDRFIGRGRAELVAGDILRALALYKTACAVQIVCVLLLLLLILSLA